MTSISNYIDQGALELGAREILTAILLQMQGAIVVDAHIRAQAATMVTHEGGRAARIQVDELLGGSIEISLAKPETYLERASRTLREKAYVRGDLEMIVRDVLEAVDVNPARIYLPKETS